MIIDKNTDRFMVLTLKDICRRVRQRTKNERIAKKIDSIEIKMLGEIVNKKYIPLFSFMVETMVSNDDDKLKDILADFSKCDTKDNATKLTDIIMHMKIHYNKDFTTALYTIAADLLNDRIIELLTELCEVLAIEVGIDIGKKDTANSNVVH